MINLQKLLDGLLRIGLHLVVNSLMILKHLSKSLSKHLIAEIMTMLKGILTLTIYLS